MLPLLDANSLSSSQILEYVNDLLGALLCELQCLVLTIQHPTQDLLPLVPTSIPFSKFLLQYGFLSVHVVCIPLGKYLVHGVHDAEPDVVALVLGPLSKPNKIIDEDINVCDQPQEDLKGGMDSRLWQQSQLG